MTTARNRAIRHVDREATRLRTGARQATEAALDPTTSDTARRRLLAISDTARSRANDLAASADQIRHGG